jgi:uncharacterized membrane protein YoaK (UPF0700 family)
MWWWDSASAGILSLPRTRFIAETTMISKLPRWIWIGTWCLSFMAGMINVTGLLGFERQAITHLTGTTTMLAAAVAERDGLRILHLAGMLGSFLLGCAVSGFITRDSALQLGRHYGVALLLEAALLATSVPLLGRGNLIGLDAAACACGLQNAMVSTYSGSVIRTTHVSGMFTDLGLSLGHLLRGVPVNPLRLRLCVLVISGFFAGGVVGTLAFWRWSYAALYLPSGLAALTALSYFSYRLHSERPPA